MQIDLTIRHSGGCTDVAVSAASGVPLRALKTGLAAALGRDDEIELWDGAHRLPPSTVLGTGALRSGRVLDAGCPGPESPAPAALALHRVGGPDAGGVVPVSRGRLVIGRDPVCDVVVTDPDVSRRHAELDVDISTIMLRDCASTNGTTVDGATVGVQGRAVTPGQLIRVGDSTFALRGPVETPAMVTDALDGTRRLLRPPRDVPTVSRREIVLPQRSTSGRPRGAQWVAALVPALAGGAIAWLTHSPQFLLFALLSPVMLMSTSVGDRLHWRKSRRRDAATYAQRRDVADREIDDRLARERGVRRRAAPDPAALAAIAALPGNRLWERRRSDADLLDVRLGLARLPSALQARHGSVVRPAGLLDDVPCCVALREGPLGVCGPPDVVDAAVRALVCQLAVLHSPADVALFLLLGHDAQSRWEWARWLPHVTGRVATTPDEWAAQIMQVNEGSARRAAPHRDVAGHTPDPWQVLIVDPARDVGVAAGLRALLTAGPHSCVSAICVAEDEASLPTACTTVARVSGATGTRATVRSCTDVGDDARASVRIDTGASPPGGSGRSAARHQSDVVLDTVTADWAQRLARNLAPVRDATTDSAAALPDSCSLLDTMGLVAPTPDEVARRWSNCAGGAATAIGVTADGPLVFDLVRDGPHALVAGTTGAGKSELLQALVAGLATEHPPDAVSFLLIDYKGGAAFGDCARLPHTVGLVTDLDGYLTARALRSLHSELRRRERLFAAHGAADLAGYRAAATTEALARLVIVVDEFATLTDELPDFVHGLVGVAQRGRSLGVHLVLATQRPRSAISAEIRANTTLRVALRVTDASESHDVIDTADAASIERRIPGRGYLRVGEHLTCFQGAHPNSPVRHTADVVVQVLDRWRRTVQLPRAASDTSELTALVDVVDAAARQTGRRGAASPWLPPLPDAMSTHALRAVRCDGARAGHSQLTVRAAVVDLPDEQRHTSVELDLRHGPSLLIAGMPRSGRTTALTTIALDAAERSTPDELQLYLVEGAGSLCSVLGRLPHVATQLSHDEPGLVSILLRRLADQCADLGGTGAMDATAAARLLLIDSWDALTAAMSDLDAAECTDLLTGLLRAGPAAALTVVVTGGRGCLMPRFAGSFGSRILLALNDGNDYGLAGIQPRDVPRHMPPGRGIRADDAAVLQFAHAGRDPGADAARDVVAEIVKRHDPGKVAGQSPTTGTAPAPAPAPAPIRIRPLPKQVTLAQIGTRSRAGVAGRRLVLGIGGDGSEPLSFDPFSGTRQMLVAGPPRSGRSTALRSLLAQALEADIRVVVAAGPRSPLASAAIAHRVQLIDPQTIDAAAVRPVGPALLLVDDCDQFQDTVAEQTMLSWLSAAGDPIVVAVAGRTDELATSYRGLGAHVRRGGCGLLLRPGPVDGEILGVRLPRRPRTGPPGRGVLIGDPAWGEPFTAGEPVPVQVALADRLDEPLAVIEAADGGPRG